MTHLPQPEKAVYEVTLHTFGRGGSTYTILVGAETLTAAEQIALGRTTVPAEVAGIKRLGVLWE